MKLSVKERLLAKELYPQQSSLINQVMVKEIDDKIKLTEAEITKIGLIELKDQNGNPTGSVQWGDDKEFSKTIKLTEAEMAFLKEQVDRVDKASLITVHMVTLCQKVRDHKPKEEDKA